MPHVKARRAGLLAAAALALAPALLAAQDVPVLLRSTTRGLMLGASLNGATLRSDTLTNGDTHSGAGFGLKAGYGFTPHFQLFLGVSAADMKPHGSSYVLSHADIGARYHFGDDRQHWRPFLEAAVTGMATVEKNVQFQGSTGDLTLSGAGGSFGGGVLYFASRHMAVDAALRWTVGSFTTEKYGNVSVTGNDWRAVTSRADIGIAWFPRG